MAETHSITRVSGVLGDKPYLTQLTFGRHALVADEPEAMGGADAGASPFALVLSGLVACTAITLRMYAERKGISLSKVRVDAVHHQAPEGAYVERTLFIEGELDEAQRNRMAEISERTPVTLALKGGMDIRTRLHAAA